MSGSNWAITRRQKIILQTSFDSNEFDIYNPSFSSDDISYQSNFNYNQIDNQDNK